MKLFQKLCIFSLLAFFFMAGSAVAESASVDDGCAVLNISSTSTGSDGSYYIDLEGIIPGSSYYLAYLYMDNNLVMYKSSFWSNSISRSEGPYSGEHTFKFSMKGSAAHNICTSSVELKAGAQKKTPREQAAQICVAIKNTADSAFKNNPANRTKALCNKLEEVALTAEYAADATDPVIQSQLYMDAIEKLSNDVAEKMDGSIGGIEGNDWITDSNAQAAIYPAVEALRNYLKEMLK